MCMKTHMQATPSFEGCDTYEKAYIRKIIYARIFSDDLQDSRSVYLFRERYSRFENHERTRMYVLVRTKH